MNTIDNKKAYQQRGVKFVSYAYKTLNALILLLMLVFSSNITYANDDDVTAEQLNTIYELSGVDSHLSWVLSVVQQESEKALQLCTDQSQLPNIESSLKEILSVQALRESFLNELQERITPDQRKEVIAWANSEPGQQVYEAEAKGAYVDEAQFSQMYEAFDKSDKNTKERTELIRTMMTNTGAVYFVSAINTEISALVTMSSVCNATPEAVTLAVDNIKKERGEEALYRAFMRQELITPAKVIYQNVTDKNVEAYIEFANSDGGQAYFSALIIGVRRVLSQQVDQLKSVIESL